MPVDRWICLNVDKLSFLTKADGKMDLFVTFQERGDVKKPFVFSPSQTNTYICTHLTQKGRGKETLKMFIGNNM